jgi:putative nucleotidyltransferase with HDIG domain
MTDLSQRAQENMKQILDRVSDIPPLPHIVIEALNIIKDPKSTAVNLANVISQDQALTARVLRLSNAAYFGYARRIKTVTEAIVILGFGVVENILYAAALHAHLSKEVEGYELQKGALWEHSMSVAIGAKTLAKLIKYPKPEEPFTAGILHDIGKTIIGKFVQKEFQTINELVDEGKSFQEAEITVLGFDHAYLGGKVAEKWNLPPMLIEAIAHHHSPMDAKEYVDIVCIVHIADAVALMSGQGIGADGLLYRLEPRAMEILNIKEEHLENIYTQVVQAFIDHRQLLELD